MRISRQADPKDYWTRHHHRWMNPVSATPAVRGEPRNYRPHSGMRIATLVWRAGAGGVEAIPIQLQRWTDRESKAAEVKALAVPVTVGQVGGHGSIAYFSQNG